MNKSLENRLECLYNRRTFGIKPGLECITKFLELLGNPQDKLRVIHIAGTNGKGSVSSMISSVIQEMGLSVGLYTSPHLVELNERFRINGQIISNDELVSILDAVDNAARELSKKYGLEATFFEYTTAIAFLYFYKNKVDVAVIETGMGGRLDATNVVANPLICVITHIALDHTAYLGDTLIDIAKEKAGIIKKNSHVVIAANDEEVKKILFTTAKEKKASTIVYAPDLVSAKRIKGDFETQKISIDTQSGIFSGTINSQLTASYQISNIITALAVIDIFSQKLVPSLPPVIIKRGLEKAKWDGRFMFVKELNAIVDGAHNPDGIKALKKSIVDIAGKKAKFNFVFGCCSDKDIESVIKELEPISKHVFFVPISNPRSANFEVLSAIATKHKIKFSLKNTLNDGLKEAIAINVIDNDEYPIIICGSLFLVGDIIRYLKNENKVDSN